MPILTRIRLTPEEPKGTDAPTTTKSLVRSKWWRWAVALILVVILGWWIIYYTDIVPAKFLPRLSSAYQAVFLTNGQVYFGKLYRQNSQYPVLREIYYLQVTQQLQPAGPQANVNLVKLGGELHGPEDEMRINRDQILFVEDLKPDSQVVVAIKQIQPSQ